MKAKDLAQKRTIEEELSYLTKGEFLNILLVMLYYFLFTGIWQLDIQLLMQRIAGATIPVSEILPYQLNWITFYPAVLLCLLLLEGSFYWFNSLNRYQKKPALSKYQIGLLFEKIAFLNVVLFFIYLPIAFVNLKHTSLIGILMGFFLYGFSLIEYINYFHIRLSFYSNVGLGLELIRPFKIILGQKKRRPSQLAREIAYFKANKI